MNDEDIISNVVQIVDKANNVRGTAFFVKKDYCVTCHHVIYQLESIKVKHQGKVYDAEWIENLAEPTNDIAILHVKGCNAEPLVQAAQHIKV